MRSRTRLAALALSVAVAGAALAAASLGTTAAPAAAAVQGCSYASATPNNGNYANTTCWFDFSSFNETTARTAAGQTMQVTLSGGYVASFTAKVTSVTGFNVMHVASVTTPIETRFAFGTDAYRGITGKPSLYSLAAPAGVKSATLTFSNIQLTDALGNPVSGFSFVAADTEDNVLGESFTWTSDKPINELERLAPNGNWGCKAPVGLGTTTVSCAGTGAGGTTIAGGKSTALLVGADSPTTFATQWVTAQRSGIAIGIQTSKLTLVKQVASRINAADSFDITARAPGNVLAGSATTGSANTATTGALDVLPNGGAYTLSEASSAGTTTPLTSYQPSWACTNVATNSTTVLPTGTGPTKTVSPAIGDDITCTITNTAIHPGLTLVKSATPVDAASYTAGQPVSYSFVLTNTGDVPLTGVTVDDSTFSGTGALSAITCPASASPLDPGEQATCTASYTLTQADVNAGTVTNSATATATTPTGATITTAPSSAVIPIDPAPAISLTKSATPATAHVAGDAIAYSFLVTNTGNVTLSGANVTETSFSGSGATPAVTCPAGAFSPGQSVTCNASYALTQTDVDAGTVTNTATATAAAALGTDPVSSPSTATVTIPAAAAVTLVKSATPGSVSAVGDTVTYSFLVTNTGNVTVSDPTVAETAFSGTGTAPVATCPTGQVAPTGFVTCTATYRVTQADLDAGQLSNTAAATATAIRGTDPVSAPSSATVAVNAAPALTIQKSSHQNGSAAAGDTVTYSFLVTNTGNVTLAGIVVNDTAFSGTGTLGAIQCPTTTLPPTADVTCTAPYTLTQADVDAGELTNTATATGTPPIGAPVTSAPSNAVQPLAAAPALTVVKSASPQAPANFQAGQQITYSFMVTNTGNVTLANVEVDEQQFTGSGTLPAPTCDAGAASLAPGTQVVCRTVYTLTQADIDAGSVTNSATATADPPGPTPAPVSPVSEVTIPQLPAPALGLVKATPTTAIDHAGQVVDYTFTVTNTGNTTLTAPTVVEGTFSGAGKVSTPDCPTSPATLLPGQFIVCTANYIVQPADLNGKALANTAIATAADPAGASIGSGPSTARVTDVLILSTGLIASTGIAIDGGGPAAAMVLVIGGVLLLLSAPARRSRRGN